MFTTVVLKASWPESRDVGSSCYIETTAVKLPAVADGNRRPVHVTCVAPKSSQYRDECCTDTEYSEYRRATLENEQLFCNTLSQ